MSLSDQPNKYFKGELCMKFFNNLMKNKPSNRNAFAYKENMNALYPKIYRFTYPEAAIVLPKKANNTKY